MQLLFSLQLFKVFSPYIYIIINFFSPTCCSLSIRLLMSYKKHWPRWEKLRVYGTVCALTCCNFHVASLQLFCISYFPGLQETRVLRLISLSFNISVHSQNENYFEFFENTEFVLICKYHTLKGATICIITKLSCKHNVLSNSKSYFDLNFKAYFKKNLLCR